MTNRSHAREAPDPAAIAAMLRESAPFSALSDAHRARIGEMSEVEFGSADVEFIRQGDVGDFAYLVLDGTVRVEVETSAGRVDVATLGAGSLVGEIGAFAETKRTASVISTTGLRCRALPCASANHPPLLRTIAPQARASSIAASSSACFR